MELQLKHFLLYIATGAKSPLERTPLSRSGLELAHVRVSGIL